MKVRKQLAHACHASRDSPRSWSLHSCRRGASLDWHSISDYLFLFNHFSRRFSSNGSLLNPLTRRQFSSQSIETTLFLEFRLPSHISSPPPYLSLPLFPCAYITITKMAVKVKNLSFILNHIDPRYINKATFMIVDSRHDVYLFLFFFSCSFLFLLRSFRNDEKKMKKKKKKNKEGNQYVRHPSNDVRHFSNTEDHH